MAETVSVCYISFSDDSTRNKLIKKFWVRFENASSLNSLRPENEKSHHR